MKATDLMIGDYVYVKPSKMVIKVAAVHNKKVAYHSCNGKLSWVGEGLLEAIPLTKEILENNGWYDAEFRGGYGRKGIRLDGLDELPVGVDNALSFAQWSLDTKFLYHLLEIYMWKGSVHLWVNYVHELQHAFRMCGITKELIYETIH